MEQQWLGSGETAKQLGVTRQTLLNWSDEFRSHIHVVRDKSGNRFYSPEVIEKLCLIKGLRDKNVSIPLIHEYFKKGTYQANEEVAVALETFLPESPDQSFPWIKQDRQEALRELILTLLEQYTLLNTKLTDLSEQNAYIIDQLRASERQNAALRSELWKLGHTQLDTLGLIGEKLTTQELSSQARYTDMAEMLNQWREDLEERESEREKRRGLLRFFRR